MEVQPQLHPPIRSAMQKETRFLPRTLPPDTLLSVAQSRFPIGYVSGNVIISVPPNLISMDERISFEDLCERIHVFRENKNSETEDDDDDDDAQGEDEDDDDNDGEDYSGEEGEEDADSEDDPEANGVCGSDGGDDDDEDGDEEDDDEDGDEGDEDEGGEDEEDEEETPQPLSKKRK